MMPPGDLDPVVVSVCMELKISPIEAMKMYYDEADCMGLLTYYNEIKRQIEETKKNNK